MMERKYPSYFDVIDIIDRALAPKGQQDYTQIKVEDIIKKFDEEIEQSGFYFKEESLISARKVIEYYFANTYGRKSNFVGGSSQDIDQNNYFFQNQLSSAKTAIIMNLANTKRLISTEFTGIVDTKELGSVEELRQRMTKENVEEYIRSVMTCSWEKGDTIRPDANALTSDILLHFGIKISDNFGREPKEFRKLREMITSFELSSRTFYGPIDREGYYQRSATKQEDYLKFIEDTIRHMTDYVYSVLKDSIDKTEEFEERRRRETASVIEISPKVETSETVPEVSIESLEATIAGYNKAQEKIEANLALAAQIAELESQIAEIRAQIAEKRAQIAENNERIKAAL